MRTSRSLPTLVAVVTCALMLLLGYLNKARCAGPPFDLFGRSMQFDEVKDAAVCYSDIQQLWLGRGINLHQFPFVDGGITAAGNLTGGTVEYPVLGGVLMWWVHCSRKPTPTSCCTQRCYSRRSGCSPRGFSDGSRDGMPSGGRPHRRSCCMRS